MGERERGEDMQWMQGSRAGIKPARTMSPSWYSLYLVRHHFEIFLQNMSIHTYTQRSIDMRELFFLRLRVLKALLLKCRVVNLMGVLPVE